MTHAVTTALFLVFFGYFILLTLYYFILGIFGIVEAGRRANQDDKEDYQSFADSFFSIPVSIIVPAHNEEMWIENSLLSILNQKYQEFEVIVVDDGSSDNTMKILTEKFHLEVLSKVYFDHYKMGKIRNIYKSGTHPNLMVLSKESGFKKAGAVNAGLNLVHYKYICVIDADTVLEPFALIRVMAQIHKDPEKTVAVGSYFGLLNDFHIEGGKILDRNLSSPIVILQNLEYIRSFIGYRIACSRFNAMPNVAGGFGVWRRDILMKLGGYSPDFSCEDIELTFRAHDYLGRRGEREKKILNLPYIVGWTEGPSSVATLFQQRRRWHRVTVETTAHYRSMLFNRRYGTFGFLTMPYFAFYEVFGIFMEIASIIFVVWGAFAGILDVKLCFAILALMILCQTILSFLSLFAFNQYHKVISSRNIGLLMGWTLTEFFWYHWIVVVARIAGTIDYLRGVKMFDQYKRV